MMENSLTIPITLLNRSALIQLPDHLSRKEIDAVQATFQQLIQGGFVLEYVVLDFAQVIFINSEVIGGMRELLNLARQHNIQLKIWSISPAIKIVITRSGFFESTICEHNTQAIIQPTSKVSIPVTHSSVNSSLKRALDIVGASIGLGILAVFLVPVVITIRLNSPGPIFVSEVRYGWLAQQFRVWKFLPSVSNPEIEGAFFKNENERRNTRVGRFLRRFCLDELLQFYNVLKGDMSLVGPRSPSLGELEHYTLDYWQCLDVKPGITGEWQVNTRSPITDWVELVRLDLDYQANWNLWHDLKLILKTICNFLIVPFHSFLFKGHAKNYSNPR